MGVTTPCEGEVTRIDANVKETYPIGAVLGYIEASEKDAARFTKQTAADVRKEVPQEIPGRADQEKVAASKVADNGATAKVPTDGLPAPARAQGAGFSSPRLRARVADSHLTA